MKRAIKYLKIRFINFKHTHKTHTHTHALSLSLSLTHTHTHTYAHIYDNEMVGWHHQLNGHKFEQTLRVSEGQGSLLCCSPQGLKELEIPYQLNKI